MVWVFRTSVTNEQEANQLAPLFKSLLPQEGKWNFDLTDCDRILRIESNQLSVLHIADTLHQQGFQCEELQE